MKTKLSLGILMMLLAELCFTLLWASVKHVGIQLPVFQIAFFRGLVSVIVIGSIMVAKRISFGINNKSAMLGRCVLGYAAMLLSFFSLTKIGIGNAVTLLHTSPIFVALLSPILLKEKTRKPLFKWILIAFAGVILVLRPNAEILQDYSVLALLSGMLAAVVYITIRHLHISDNTFTITFYFTLFVCVASLPFMIFQFETPSKEGWIVMLGAGIFGTLAQLLMTYAYKYGPANILTPFNNAAILFSFLIGWFVWGETPTLIEIIGASLIITAIIAISLVVNRHKISKDLPVVGENPVR
jgi:drug/metabolite transporter (DMT)-like permease